MHPTPLHRPFFFLLMAAALAAVFAAPVPIFWEREFEYGVTNRDQFCTRVGLGSAADEYGLTDASQWQALGKRLVAYENAEDPWSAFFSGMVLTRTSSDPGGAENPYAATYFGRALSLCSAHPGLSWVLAGEFRRFGLSAWEEKSLKNLERLFLAGGAQSAPIVVQQLLWQASQASASRRTDEAFRYLEWAALFDRHPVWPLVRSALIAFPLKIARVNTAFADLASIVQESWIVQLSLLRAIEQWLFYMAAFAVVAILLALGWKYVPRTLHRITHRFSSDASMHVRLGLAGALFASTISFGLIPFLWLTGLLMWRHLAKREKIIAGVCLVLLALAPVHTRLRDMLSQPFTPKNPLFLFEKAVNEGYYPELEAAIAGHVREQPDSYLAHLAGAIVSLKKGDSAAASLAIRTAEKLQPSDPVILLTAANIFQFSHNMAAANEYFTKCISAFPELEASYFNPTLLYFDERRFIEGIDLIKNASKINPRIVGMFTRKNDDYFAGAWPPLRLFLQPDYRPDYFFRAVLMQHAGSWTTADAAWGSAFLGIPLLPSCVIGLLLLVLIAGRNKLPLRSPDDFACRLCGIPMCRSCKRGDMCLDCHLRAGDISDPAMLQKLRQAIVVRHQRRQRILPHVVNGLFPGLGSLVFTNGLSVGGLLLTPVTAIIYGSWMCAALASYSVPAWIARDALLPLHLAAAGYGAFFLVRNALTVVGIVRGK